MKKINNWSFKISQEKNETIITIIVDGEKIQIRSCEKENENMKTFACLKCGWSGEEIEYTKAHTYFNIEESELNEEENHFIEVCPKCVENTMVYQLKI